MSIAVTGAGTACCGESVESGIASVEGGRGEDIFASKLEIK